MSNEPHLSQGEPLPPVAADPGNAPLPGPASEVKFTRAAALWTSLILGFLILAMLAAGVAVCATITNTCVGATATQLRLPVTR